MNLCAANIRDCGEEQTMKTNILYCRLSREDGDTQQESNSIGNQKRMLAEYAERNGFVPYEFAVDDGYSGTNYNRPGWQELISKVEAAEVGVIIVKNLDRMGRNYLQTGLYREMFAERGVRLIAISDGIDTFTKDDDFTPFREIMAEWFARDTSRKIKAVMQSKGKSGKHISSHPPYGYKKSESDKNLWLPDEPAATVVRRIFQLTIDGFGPFQIAEKLSAEKVECPSYYFAQRGVGRRQTYPHADPFRWWYGTVRDIIARVDYMGHTVNFKTSRVSYKNKRMIFNEREKWAIFENTHEAIVTQEIWELANKLRGNAKRHVDRLGAPRPLTGLLFCAQCGAKMYNDRSSPTAIKQKDYYTCSNYSTQHRTCTSHRINTKTIEALVKETLKTVGKYAIDDEASFTKMVTEMYAEKLNNDVKKERKRLAACEKRSAELDMIIKKLFEQDALGTMNTKRFELLSAEYEKEQADLVVEIEQLRIGIDSYVDSKDRAVDFLKLARRYRDFEELTPAVINSFVEKIYIHERADKGCQITEQKIDIHLSFIGNFILPKELLSEPDAEQVARDNERAKRREYHREYSRRRKENGGKPLTEMSPEERAKVEAERKEKEKLYQREYQREFQRRKARAKRYAEEFEIAQACAQVIEIDDYDTAPTPAA